MKSADRVELEELQRRQALLTVSLRALTNDIYRLKERLEVASAVEEIPSPAPVEEPVALAPRITQPTPPPLPPIIEAMAPVPPLSEPPVRETTSPVTPPKRETLEMKLGTYWLVRVGIVMLLTGLVFLGTYAYKNYIGKLGAPGKVALLYTASAILLGAGAWLQRRREKENMRNYGQVLFAGGLAAVFFTTYAAHYVPVLRIITSPIIDGLLLLGWGAVTMFIADRRKSEVLALFAIGLSYYTSAITSVGLFTLYSNLVLTGAAVFLLVRNRWALLSFISVFATYGSFAFWRFHHGQWSWGARSELLIGDLFLSGYWIFFTAAVFLARESALARARRATFATLNNAAFFSLVVLSMMHVMHDDFWKFSLGFGAVLLACSAAAKRFLSSEPMLKNAYLVQGLVLVTMGFIAYFTGLKLALVLAAESVVLTVFGQQRNNIFLKGAAVVAAVLAGGWVIYASSAASRDVLLGSGIALGMVFNGWWTGRHDTDPIAVSPLSGFFSGLAIVLTGVITWHGVSSEWRAVAWMLEALAFTGACYLLRTRELPIFAQGLAVFSQCGWFFEFAMKQQRPHWIVPAVLIAGTLALSHWWQRQRQLKVASALREVLQLVYALALVGVIFFWLQPQFAPSAWLVFLNGLAVAITIYGVLTRAWMLAACAQVFLIVSGVEFAHQLTNQKPQWAFALVPIVTILLLGLATTIYLSRNKTSEAVSVPLLQVSMFYRGVAFIMSVWWVFAYIPATHQFWTLILLSYAVLAVSGVWRNREALAYSGIFAALGLAWWSYQWTLQREVITWANALTLVSLLAIQQVLRRNRERWPLPPHADTVLILATGCAVWAFVSRWTVLTSGAQFLLTVSWAGLAFLFFALGFLVRERMHRWLGLGILALAIARVFLFDVWKLETIYRIVSFMALGVVLLTLGFIYNKYQEKIRQWL